MSPMPSPAGVWYDYFCGQADSVFSEDKSICNIHRDDKDDRIACSYSDTLRKHGIDFLCCTDCKHLGPYGCTVESLGCKVFCCEHIQEKRPDVIIRMDTLRAGMTAKLVPFPERKSKEESLEA